MLPEGLFKYNLRSMHEPSPDRRNGGSVRLISLSYAKKISRFSAASRPSKRAGRAEQVRLVLASTDGFRFHRWS